MNTNKTTVITGASAGIGAALARELAGRGQNLVLFARREKELHEVATSIGKNVVSVVGDATRRADLEHLRDDALKRFGQIDVWVNNVGRGITRAVLELTDDDLSEMLDINIRSAVYGMQIAGAYFKERDKGHIINVSSMLGRIPFLSQRSAYSAMKAALNSLTTNLRQELAQNHPAIQVSLVMPGVVITEFGNNALHGTPGYLPAKVPGAQTAEEVALTIADLIEHPKAELYTNPNSAGMVRKYWEEKWAAE